MFKKEIPNIFISYDESPSIRSKTLTKSQIKNKSISPIKTRSKYRKKSISPIRSDRSHKSKNDRIYDKFACQIRRITGKSMNQLDTEYGSDIRRGAIKLLMLANYPKFELFNINYYGNIIADNIPNLDTEDTEDTEDTTNNAMSVNIPVSEKSTGFVISENKTKFNTVIIPYSDKSGIKKYISMDTCKNYKL